MIKTSLEVSMRAADDTIKKAGPPKRHSIAYPAPSTHIRHPSSPTTNLPRSFTSNYNGRGRDSIETLGADDNEIGD